MNYTKDEQHKATKTIAWNNCLKINPANPAAVAESIPEMYEALKVALEFFVVYDIHNKGISGLALQLNEALAKAESKEGEGDSI